MDAGKLWMLSDFIGTNKVQFQIPVYQRNYDWSVSNCNRLLDDIKAVVDTGDKHFLGTIVFMSSKDTGFSLKEYIIIDGQQRLTTMMLILKALCDLSKEKDEECFSEIADSYLQNHHCAEEYKIKLKPIKGDNDQFVALLKHDEADIDKNGHIWLNYALCKARIQTWLESGILPRSILEGLEKLEMVYIQLTKGEDDPQIIFESINSTGLELSNADLIRNFLLMDAENQDELFEKYWLYIEKSLKHSVDYTNLNLFFMQYIIYKTNTPVTENKLYERFVKLYKQCRFDSEDCLKELKYFADIFKAFVYDSDEYSLTIMKSLRSIRQLNSTTSYPFLFHVFDDYKRGIIDLDTLEKVLQFLFSYLLRRSVCGIPTNSLRGLFTYLYSRVFKVKGNKEKYYPAINKFLCTLMTKDAMPTDVEFEQALKQTNIYRNAALCKFILMDIENGGGKETLDINSLTIEHIMPQTLNLEWKHISEENHKQYLHVLGNLSVSGYNSELSNRSFDEKKKIIRENSKAVVLNNDVWDKNIWDINCIVKRGERLAEIIMKHYPIECIQDDSINFEYISTITLDDYSYVTGKKLVNFKFEDNIYIQNTYAMMLVDMIRLLDKINPTLLGILADHDFSYAGTKSLPRISYHVDTLRLPTLLRDGIYVDLNLSAKAIMRFIEILLEKYNIPKDSFSISVVAEDKMN